MIIKNFKNLKGKQLLAYSIVFFVTIFILRGLADFSIESVARLSGRMATFTVPISEFEKVALVEKIPMNESEEGKLISTDSDPQLLLTQDIKASRISFKAEFSVHPGEITMYYTTKDGQGFASTKRYWFFPSQKDVDLYETSFSLKNIKSLRLDPTTEAGNEIKISEVTFNSPKSFLAFFAVGYSEIFHLLVHSSILASLLALVQEIVIKKSK